MSNSIVPIRSLAPIHSLARITVAFVWLYHGLVPKLMGPHLDELHLASLHGLDTIYLPLLLKIAGALEMMFGVAVLLFWQARWPFVLSIAGLIALLIDVSIIAPQYLLGAFNPLSLNVAVISLSVIGYLTVPHNPASHQAKSSPNQVDSD